MRIGELAAATGLTREALRFYESRGLLRARRGGNGYRDYPPHAIELVNYIRLGQSLGFTLAEVGEALPQLWDAETGGGLDEERLAALLRDKLAALDARIAGLARLRDELAQRLLLGCPLAAQAAGVEGPGAAGRALRAESIAASTASVRSTRS